MLLTSCQVPAPAVPQGVVPRFQLTADTEAVPVTPAGQPAQSTASLVVDLSAFLTTFTGYRRVMAAIADVERVVVTLLTADGQTFTQTLNRAAIAAGLNALSFTGLPAGGARVTVEALDAANQVLASTTVQATVVAGRTADLAVVSPVSASSGSSGGSSGSAPTAAPTTSPAGLALGVTIQDTVAHQNLTGGTSLDGMSGLSDVAFDPAGHAWATSALTYHHLPFAQFWNHNGLFRFEAGAFTNTFIDRPIDPYDIAIDGAGAMWVTSLANRTLTKLGTTITMVPNLVPVATVPTLATCQLPAVPVPRGLTVDATGQAWVANGEHLTQVTPAGTIVATHPLGAPAGAVTADHARGVIWATAGNRLVKLSTAGVVAATTAPFTRSPHNDFAGLAVDAAGSVWLAVPGDNAIARFDADGTALARIELDWPVRDLVIDSQGQVWAAVGLIHSTFVSVARFSPQGALRQTFGRPFGSEAIYVAPNDAVWVKDIHGQITRVTP